MAPRNAFHRLGDAFAALFARLRFARDALTGAFPLPTPLERNFIMTTHSRLAALETALAAVNDRLNTVDDTVKQAASDSVSALETRVAAIEADLNTDGPAAVETPATDLTPAPAA